jgi:WD40 repeat protein
LAFFYSVNGFGEGTAQPGAFPPETKGFQQTKTTKLGAVWGDYKFKRGCGGDLRFSPDGKLLFAGDCSDFVWVFETASGREVRRFPENPSNDIHHFDLSPDGMLLAANDSCARIFVAEVATGRNLAHLETTQGGCWYGAAMAFFPDSKRVAGLTTSLEDESLILVWDARTGKLEKKFAVSSAGRNPMFLRVSPDGRFLLGGAGERMVLWDAGTGKEIWVRSVGRNFDELTFSVDGMTIITSDDGPRNAKWYSKGKVKGAGIQIWDTKTGNLIRAIPEASAPVSLAVDGKRLISGGKDAGVAYVREMKTGKLLKEVQLGSDMADSAWSSDGRSLAFSGTTNSIHILELVSGEKVGPDPDSSHVSDLSLSPDGKHLFSGNRASVLGAAGLLVTAWDAEQGVARTHSQVFPESSGIHRGTYLVLMEGPKRWITGTGWVNPSVSIWDSYGVKLVKRWAQTEFGNFAGLSPDGKRIVFVRGKELRILDAKTDALIQSFEDVQGHKVFIHSELTPDGNSILYWNGKVVRFRDVDGKNPPYDFDVLKVEGVGSRMMKKVQSWFQKEPAQEGHAVIRLSPSGKLFASASSLSASKGVLKIWDLKSHKLQRTLTDFSFNDLRFYGFSPDDRFFAAICGKDPLVRIWDLNSGKELDAVDLSSSGDAPTTVLFSRDGQHLYVGTARGMILKFQILI